MRYGYSRYTKFIVVAALALVAQAVGAQQAHHTSSKAPTAAKSMDFQPGLEPRAIAILKASSAMLASAQSMAFTAVVSYESPSRRIPFERPEPMDPTQMRPAPENGKGTAS
ncbi:MAG: hypothetical protein QOG58_5392 [Caballeronia sp.]|nr:hypothetical protein [Caballeronia sp.]